ncbi:hypothetical protein FRC01_007921 [Tulasnella sp. 417]|nr:hypothetical protein FRC01_007921 [Tulasnella sp. 417]
MPPKNKQKQQPQEHPPEQQQQQQQQQQQAPGKANRKKRSKKQAAVPEPTAGPSGSPSTAVPAQPPEPPRPQQLQQERPPQNPLPPPPPPPPPSTSAPPTESGVSSSSAPPDPPAKGRAKAVQGKKSSTPSEPAAGKSRRKRKGVNRARAPTLAAAILRARALDPRLQQRPGQPPISAEDRDDPHLLPWVPHLLDALELPKMGMFDPDFTDSRGRKPDDEDRREFTVFWETIKQRPDICSHEAMKDIPGSATWLRWANGSWAPRLSALVRAELVRTGDSWTQRQLKVEAGFQIDMSPATVANEKKADILSVIFGPSAYNGDKHTSVLSGMDVIVKDLVYRVCDQDRKRYRALQPTMQKARETLDEALLMMKTPEVDIKKFKDAVTRANQLRRVYAGVSIEPEGVDEERLDQFTTASLDVIAKKEALFKGAGGTTDRMVWSKEQIDAAKEIYAAHFLTSDDLIDISNDETLTDTVLGTVDLGVDLVCALDKPELYRRLGIPSTGHIPHIKPFEAIRATLPKGGPSEPWDFQKLLDWADKELDENEKTTPAELLHPVPRQRGLIEEEVMERKCPRTHRLIRGHLHQVQGVLAIAEQAFKKSEGPVHVSTLLADSMGLGKTLTAIAYALMVSHWFELQQPTSDRGMPPHFANRFWCGFKDIPQGPIIIITPNNLLSQWVSELRSFVVPALVDILVFDPRGRGAAEKWWAEDYKQSLMDEHRRIIVTTYNAVKREADRLLRPTGRGLGDNYRCGERIVPLKDGTVDLFSIRPSVNIIDEAHGCRNVNRDAHGILKISCNSHHTLGLTGTPVYNATLDLLAQACVLGIPDFVGDNYLAKKAEVTKLLPKRREKASLPHGANDMRASILAAQSQLVQDNQEAIALLKEWFAPHIIRRTMASKDPYGNRILPPIHNTVSKSFVKLSEAEDAKTKAMSEDVLDSEEGGTRRVFNSQNFYTEYRLCLQWPGHRRVNSVNRSTIRSSKDWTLDDFAIHHPSKMFRVAEILDHHIPEELRRPENPTDDVDVTQRVRTALHWEFPSGDQVLPPSQEAVFNAWEAQQAALTAKGGSLQAEPAVKPPDMPIVGGLRRIKIIITLTYTMYLPILVRLLQLRGYAVRTFTGDTPPNERGKIIEEFNADDAHPADGGGYSFILVMSGIGITGLNCTRGSVMIHFDQAWSQQEENQATHRIVRLGQIEHCLIYKVLALGTTDIWMNQIASGKELMLDLFSGTDSIALRALKDPNLLEIGIDDETQPLDIDAPQLFDQSTVLHPPTEEPTDPNFLDTEDRPAIPYADKGKQREGEPPIPPSHRHPPIEVDQHLAEIGASLANATRETVSPAPNFDEFLHDLDMDVDDRDDPPPQLKPSKEVSTAGSIGKETTSTGKGKPKPPSEASSSTDQRWRLPGRDSSGYEDSESGSESMASLQTSTIGSLLQDRRPQPPRAGKQA